MNYIYLIKNQNTRIQYKFQCVRQGKKVDVCPGLLGYKDMIKGQHWFSKQMQQILKMKYVHISVRGYQPASNNKACFTVQVSCWAL